MAGFTPPQKPNLPGQHGPTTAPHAPAPAPAMPHYIQPVTAPHAPAAAPIPSHPTQPTPVSNQVAHHNVSNASFYLLPSS
jgi:hypothetical protein